MDWLFKLRSDKCYRSCWGTNSRGAYTSTPGKVGFWPQSNEGINDRIELRKSDIVVLHGCNPAWSSAGNPAYHLLQIKKYNPNAKFISIDPLYNDSAALVEAEWIPIRPSTRSWIRRKAASGSPPPAGTTAADAA